MKPDIKQWFAQHHWFLPWYLAIIGAIEAFVILHPFG